MAKPETWERVKFFRPDSKLDNWGDPDAIDDVHIERLDDFRRYIGVPVIVTNGVKFSGHKPKSWHYGRKDDETGEWLVRPCATDVVIPGYPRGPVDLVLDAHRFGFTGIGYYPHWGFNGDKVGGLHLDSRPLQWDPDFTLNYSHSRWMGVLNDKGEQEYIPLTYENLLKYSKGGVNGPT